MRANLAATQDGRKYYKGALERSGITAGAGGRGQNNLGARLQRFTNTASPITWVVDKCSSCS